MDNMENDDILQSLNEAPPHAPTADDAEATKATSDAANAQQLVKAAIAPRPLGQPDAEGWRNPVDVGADAAASKPRIPAPGSFADHLSNALQDAKKNADPATLAQPGSWSKLMVGATMDALTKTGQPAKPPAGSVPTSGPWAAAVHDNGAPAAQPKGPSRGQRFLSELGGSFGDLAAATEGGPSGGALAGAARVARAEHQRHGEEEKNRQLMATSNAQMLHEQALTHKMGEDAINESINASKSQMENITTPIPGAPADAAGRVVAKDKNSDELDQMIKSGELNPSEETVFATGRILEGKDANGQPKYRTTYTVVRPASNVDLTPENAKYLNEQLGTEFSTDPEKMQRLPGVQVNDLFQKANNARIAKRAFEVGQAKDDETIRKAQTSKDAESIFRNPLVMNAINGHMTNPDDPFAIVKAYNAIVNDPKLLNNPSMPKNFSEAYIQAAGGTAVWDKKVEEYAKAQQKSTDLVGDMLDTVEKKPQEIEGHTPAFTAAMKSIIADPQESTEKKARASKALETILNVRQLELELEGAKETNKENAKLQAGRGTESDKVGEEFLNSLPKSRQSVLKGFAEGRVPVSPSALQRTDKGQALMSDLLQAYPDFQSEKGETWYKTHNEYVGSGKTAAGLTNVNIAMGHLKRLFDNSTTEGLYNPLSTAYRDRQADFAIVTNEVGKAIKNGVMTEGEGKDLRSALSGWIPSSARERAKEVGKLLKNRLDEMQTKFDDAAPSAMIKVPRLFSKDAEASFNYIQSDGKVPSKAPAGAIQRPADLPTATHTQQFTKGGVTKTFWTDASGKPLREATEIPKE